MSYRDYLEKAINELKAYAGEIDVLVGQYKTEKHNFEKRLEDMKRIYTNSYIDETRKNWRPINDYATAMAAKREPRKVKVTYYLDLIDGQMKNIFNGPISQNFVNKINAIKTTGLQLSKSEYQMLAKEAGSYFEQRLLSTLQHVKSQNDIPQINSGDLPDIDRIDRTFGDVKSSMLSALDNYAGAGSELKEFIGTGGVHSTIDSNMRLIQTQAAANIIEGIQQKDYFAYFTDIMDKAEKLRPSRKTELTDKDRAFINALIPPADYEKYEHVAISRAVELSRESPEIANVMLLDDRFSEAVQKALAE